MVKELQIYDVFPVVKKDENIFAGVFDSETYPYSPEPPIRCNFYASMLFIQGSGFIVADNYEFEVKPRRIFLFTDRQVIGWSYYENTIAYIMAFNAHIATALNIRFDKQFIDLSETDYQLFLQVFENSIREFEQRDHAAIEIIQGAIVYTYRLLARKAGTEENADRFIKAIREFVCQDFTVNHTVESVAQSLSLPVREMNERCIQALGISAKQYMLELKLTEAKRLLAFTELTASEISYHTGFEDPSYFTRLFRKKTGMTPVTFREKYQKKS